MDDPDAWALTPEARRFMTDSSSAWASAYIAAGATQDEAGTAMDNTTKFYVP
jgi:hypothetical protein